MKIVKKQTFWIIPKDFIAFDEGLKGKEFNGRGRVVYEHVPANELISLNEGNLRVTIVLCHLEKAQIDSLKSWHIESNEYQIALKITVEYEKDKEMEYWDAQPSLMKYAILSFILSTKEVKPYFLEGSSFHLVNIPHQPFLPYAFIRLSEGGVNFYYQSDYSKLGIDSKYYSRLETPNINLLRELLKKFFVEMNRHLPEPTIPMFVHVHTFSWVTEGLLYPAVIIMFSCFESILGKNAREDLSSKNSVFADFGFFRHAIAHLDKFSISLSENEFTITRGRDNESRAFDLNKLRIVREMLIEEVLKKLEQEGE